MPRKLKPCGTRAAYDRHIKHGETPCDACIAGRRAYNTAHGHSPAEKSVYDANRYGLIADKKRKQAKDWYHNHIEEKAEYDITYRPVKNKRRRTRYAADPEAVLAPLRGLPNRIKNLKKYKLTLASFEALLDQQKGKCACCRSSKRVGTNWCVDHDHRNGVVRGILCVRCNTGIGMLGDDIHGVNNARLYLDSELPLIDDHY